MKRSLGYQLKRMMLPGLKRWIVIVLVGIAVIIFGVFLLLGHHPVAVTTEAIRRALSHATDLVPYTVSGLIVLGCGGTIIVVAVIRMIKSVLGAYEPNEREAIPDALYKRRHLESGPRVVVIGGGTGLSTLLRGLKAFTNNITAVVTVGDDGGSSGRLREELGVLPPGDIRNCITALADEDKLVTDLFRYRFESGEGLEGHSFGNLFLTALCDMTNGDILEAVRVAGRVLNSCGTVLPSTLKSIQLVAELEDGRIIEGESNIGGAGGKIKRLTSVPPDAKATPEAVDAILDAELIVLGPGSLYTSIVPNLLIPEIADAIKRSKARRIYVCNVITQAGETTDYSVCDHLDAVVQHANVNPQQSSELLDAILVNDTEPELPEEAPGKPVRLDLDRLSSYSIPAIQSELVSEHTHGHHDPEKLAKSIIYWFTHSKRKKSGSGTGTSSGNGGGTVDIDGQNKAPLLEKIASTFF